MKSFISMDKDTKELILKVSSLMGLKPSSVREILEYLYITWLLQVSEQDTKDKNITIPFLGKLKLNFNGELIEETKEGISYECSSEMSLNDSAKKLLSKSSNNNQEEIINILKGKIRRSLE